MGSRPEAMMPLTAHDATTPLQRLIVERALDLAREPEAAADSAPDGQVIDRCESFLLGAGRDSLRRAPEVTLQSQLDALEQKGRPAGSAPAAPRVGTRGGRPDRR